jgi:hypothetical protein
MFNLVRREVGGELVLMIPPHVLPAQWSALEFPPTTFEMQVRYAEPDNDVSYQANGPRVQEDVGAESNSKDLRPAREGRHLPASLLSPSGTVPHTESRRAKVFVSYAPFDARFLDQLEKHLSSLRREGIIEVWNHQRIVIGEDWKATAAIALQEADIILLLISADFIDSDSCFDTELAHAIRRHRDGTARVCPIVVRRVDWGNLPFADLLALPRNGRPIAQWTDPDDAWAEVSQEIRQVAMLLRGD